ncbi:Scr1 family TA system antitoxin-like transcriptional regulator [Actinomadura sp. 3N508]|uniref:helix-turn-helix domain-containing protein n=1 Tax=Actinomadura sp. 3N508 TaxID=3375153 RepID=UPI0037A55182
MGVPSYRRKWDRLVQLDSSGGQLVVNRKQLDPSKSVAALFGAKLRDLRDKAGLSQAQLGDAIGYSNDTISKVETAAQAPSPELARCLDAHFNTNQFDELQPHAARESIPSYFRPYADLESTAIGVRVYEPVVITGLLQTDEYARAVLRPGQRPSKLDQSVAARMLRQEVLRREDPPWVVILLAEPVVRKLVGNKEITSAQLAHVLELADDAHVNVLVVPNGADVYPSSGFTLFSREDEPDLGYVEGAAGLGRVIEQSTHVERLRRLWDIISSAAMSEAASKALIREVMEGL